MLTPCGLVLTVCGLLLTFGRESFFSLLLTLKCVRVMVKPTVSLKHSNERVHYSLETEMILRYPPVLLDKAVALPNSH